MTSPDPCGEVVRDRKPDAADAGVRGDRNGLFPGVGEVVQYLLVEDVGEAAADDADTGEYNCTGLWIFLLASSRIASMVTFLLEMIVSSANGREENAGTKFCDAKPEDTDKAEGRLRGNDGGKSFPHSPT